MIKSSSSGLNCKSFEIWVEWESNGMKFNVPKNDEISICSGNVSTEN